jgi:pSer/pThr/pTyr-binding forkhead associated (FHA) protein
VTPPPRSRSRPTPAYPSGQARIIQEALSFAIEDNGSTNGTFVNGQRVTRQALVPGDVVVIGQTQLRVE